MQIVTPNVRFDRLAANYGRTELGDEELVDRSNNVFGTSHQLSGRDVYNNHEDNVTPKQQAHAANDETPHYLTRAANFAVGLPNDFASLDCLDNCDK